MALNGIELVACDLDGTLLLDGRDLPTPRALELIGELDRAGVSVFAASGRQYASLCRLFGPVADRMGYVCENGALVMYRGQELLVREVPRPLAMRVCHAVLDYPGADLIVSGERYCYTRAGNDWFIRDLIERVHNDVATFVEPEEIEGPILKMAFRIDHDAIPAAIEHLSALFSDDFAVVTSGNVWIDFLPHGVNKGTALAAVGERLGIPAEHMAAFGDNENDREMLTYVGHPYLMETCNPTMRDIARARFTPTVEAELERILAAR